MDTSFCKNIYESLCKKYPNRNIYVISDHHFYHSNIIHYTRNNFSNVEEMNQYIIKSHNEIVKKEDIVIFLGDFCFKNSYIKHALSYMNGHKYLILGNHDQKEIIKHYPTLGFEEVFTTPVRINKDYLSHEPLLDGERRNMHFESIVREFNKDKKGTNYHGHIHITENISSKHKNVTCEAIEYKPIKIGKTMELTEKDEKDLFINTPFFDEMLILINQKHNINPSIVISDYIYSTI